MLGELKAALSVFDWIRKFFKEKKAERATLQETIADRFIKLFENHGVHRNQIPRFFEHGISIESVQTNEKLMKVLTEDALKDVCVLFGVRREWLDGADEQIYEHYDFYKRPEKFASFLDNILSKSDSAKVDGILLVPFIKDDSGADAVIIIQEQVGTIENRPVYRHFISYEWPFQYWKSRAYLTACIGIGWKRNVYITGRKVPASEIRSLADGFSFLGFEGNDCYFNRYEHFYPEDMTLYSEKFLEGVDPEVNNFGHISAIELWLQLDDEGYMDSGFKKNVRSTFKKQLRLEKTKAIE